MCGIFGCIGEIDSGKAWECVTRIKHRGPDAMHVEQLDGVTLSHARLSVVDISEAANQPFCSLDKRFWIVYNGEIYNFIELKEELETLGYKFRTQSDTEVILNAYLQWGEAFQKKCNGMWALAIWDSYERKMFFSRDRFGVKPLYWYYENDNFYFASEIKAFFPVMKERKINYNLFTPYNSFGYETLEESCFRGVKKIMPGHCATYYKGELKISRWWNTLDNLQQVPRRYEEQIEVLQKLFYDAVKIRMRSDVPIGTALSGGVDSSAIVGMIARIMNGGGEKRFSHDWQNAFVATMKGSFNDETEWAKMAAYSAGVNLHEVDIYPPTPEELMKYVYMSEEPYDTAMVPHFRIYEGIKKGGIKVTIDGLGADEIFAGYEFDLQEVMQCKEASDSEVLSLLETYRVMYPEKSKITLEEIQRLPEVGCLNTKLSKLAKERGLDTLNQVLFVETHERVLPTILRTADKFSMASGVEARYPFMDYRIISFAFSIPWSSKVRNGYSKAIERDMARPYMAKAIVDRKDKIGFNDPLHMWFSDSLKEFLLDTIHSKEFYECELINSLQETILAEEFLRAEADYSSGHRLWYSIGLFLWEKIMVKGYKF